MSKVFFSDVDNTAFEPFDVGVVQWLRKSSDDEPLSAGYWKVTPDDAPEPFDLTIEQHETIYIVSGHLRIEVENDRTLELTTGSSASLSPGAMTRWSVLEPTVEFFVYS